MIYGYAVIEKSRGKEYWEADELFLSIKKVRLFRTESERDNGINLENDKLMKNDEWWRNEVKPFETKGKLKNGEINVH